MNVYLLQVINGIGIGMLYFLLAFGLSIVFGLLRFVNFAHGVFYALGAYACYQAIQWGANFWLTLIIGPCVVGIVAWVAERLLLRKLYDLSHEFHIVFTVGLALFIQELIILIWGPVGVNVPPPDLLKGVIIWGNFIYPKYRVFIIVFTAVLAILIWFLLERTRLGSMVRAGSESPETVTLLGINIYRIFSFVFALGAATAGLAGTLAAPLRGVEPFMGNEALAVAFVVVVIGGMGSFTGALLGGLLVGVVQSVMSTLWPVAANLMIYVSMALILLLMPRGLLGRS